MIPYGFSMCKKKVPNLVPTLLVCVYGYVQSLLHSLYLAILNSCDSGLDVVSHIKMHQVSVIQSKPIFPLLSKGYDDLLFSCIQ